MAVPQYDAVLIQSFGGPEGPDDVIPFLENVLADRNVPRKRLLEVAEHYHQFGGISPINQQCRDLVAALRNEFRAEGISLPIYWGNRNWHPFLADTFREIHRDGVRRVLSFVTSAFSSYSGCRQYLEDIAAAQTAAEISDLRVDKLRVFFNHPDFIAVVAESVTDALSTISGDLSAVRIAFTAHSIPVAMAQCCDYEQQLTECCRLVAESVGVSRDHWDLVYQSRSGRPEAPWLEPDICEHIRRVHDQGGRQLVISPIGFLSDHIEVMYDLDTEARSESDRLRIQMQRAATPGTHPRFVRLIGKLVQERTSGDGRESIGRFPAHHDECPPGCCALK